VITVSDTTDPVLQGVPADTSASCDSVPTAASPTATDNCDPRPSVTYNQVRADETCPHPYTLTRTWTAHDRCGNTSNQSQVITVSDTTNPALQGVPADTSASCNSVPAAASPTPTSTCDPRPSVTYPQARTYGSCQDNCTPTRTWTAHDRCG